MSVNARAAARYTFCCKHEILYCSFSEYFATHIHLYSPSILSLHDGVSVDDDATTPYMDLFEVKDLCPGKRPVANVDELDEQGLLHSQHGASSVFSLNIQYFSCVVSHTQNVNVILHSSYFNTHIQKKTKIDV